MKKIPNNVIEDRWEVGEHVTQARASVSGHGEKLKDIWAGIVGTPLSSNTCSKEVMSVALQIQDYRCDEWVSRSRSVYTPPHMHTRKAQAHICAHLCRYICIHSYMHTYTHTHMHVVLGSAFLCQLREDRSKMERAGSTDPLPDTYCRPGIMQNLGGMGSAELKSSWKY